MCRLPAGADQRPGAPPRLPARLIGGAEGAPNHSSNDNDNNIGDTDDSSSSTTTLI